MLSSFKPPSEARAGSTYVLVRDDLDVLHVSGGFKDLPQDLLSDSGVQPTNVKSSFVRFRGGAPDGTAGAHGGGDAVGLDRERVVVLRDVEPERRLRRHGLAVAVLEGGLARHGRRHGEGRGGLGSVVGHCDDFPRKRGEESGRMQGFRRVKSAAKLS